MHCEAGEGRSPQVRAHRPRPCRPHRGRLQHDQHLLGRVAVGDLALGFLEGGEGEFGAAAGDAVNHAGVEAAVVEGLLQFAQF